MNKSNLNKTGYVVGIISVLFYLVCSFWGGLFVAPALKALHLSLLQLTYPGFAFTISGYLIGLVEAFIYGWVIGVLFVWLCKKLCVECVETKTK